MIMPMQTIPPPITDQDRALYERDGVVCLKQMFDTAWIDFIGAAVEDAMTRAPGNAGYERLKASIQVARADHEGARTTLDAAVQHDHRNPEVYRERAAVLLDLSDSAGARRNMDAATRLQNGTAPTSPP